MGSGLFGDFAGDGVADLFRTGISADIGSADFRSSEHGCDSFFDRVGGLGSAEVTQHHRARPDLSNRVRDPLPGDVRRRTVDGFKHRREFILRIQIRGGSNADGADNRGAEIGENIPKKVGTHDNIEPVGVADKMRGEDVDVELVGADIGKLPGDRSEAFIPEGHSVNDAV